MTILGLSEAMEQLNADFARVTADRNALRGLKHETDAELERLLAENKKLLAQRQASRLFEDWLCENYPSVWSKAINATKVERYEILGL